MKTIVKFAGHPLHFWRKPERQSAHCSSRIFVTEVASVTATDEEATQFRDRRSAEIAVLARRLDETQVTYHELQ
jgi:hypothetical protein